MYIILRWVLNTFVLLLVGYLVPGINIESFFSALIAALILGLVNAVIRPILLILTLPVNILSLGLFTFVLNAIMFLIVSSIVKGFDITSFGAAFWGALIYWIITWIINLSLVENETIKSGN